MAKFVKVANGSYVNLDQARSIYAIGGGSAWYAEIYIPDQAEQLSGGPWTTEAEVEDAIRQLVDGVSIENYVD